jgi:hypothetical protein
MDLLTITVQEVIVRFVAKRTIASLTVMVSNSTSINKTNNHLLNSDGQQIHQYQQNEVIVRFVDTCGIVDHHCSRGDCSFC